MPSRRSGSMLVRRPDRLVLVAGTATDVGKTWVAATVARELRRLGTAVAARKPVQSFDPGPEPTDAEVLGEATGEDPEQVCPSHRWYPLAMAPPMAAAALGRPPFSIGDLTDELRWPRAVEVGLVEGVGGPRSPLASDGDTVDVARVLAPDLILLVADAGLGTINATRLSAGAFGTARVLVVLNRFDGADGLHRGNRSWLRDRCGLVVTLVEDLAPRLRERIGAANRPAGPD